MTQTFDEIMKEWQEYLAAHPEIAKAYDDYYKSFLEEATQKRTYTFTFYRDEQQSHD